MKKIRLLSLFGIALVTWMLVGCSSNNKWGDIIIEDITPSNDVVDYNDALVDAATVCLDSENEIWNTYYSEDASTSDIQTAVDNTLSVCQSAINQINTLWDREWDSSLKDGVIAVLEKDIVYYNKFIEMLPFLDQEELTEEDKATYDNLTAELEAIDQEIQTANDNLVVIQDQFSQNHGYELETLE